jgi:YVTN family beta-propeller protein
MARIITALTTALLLLPCVASARTVMYVPSGEMKTVALQPAPYHVAYAGDLNKLYVSSRKAPKIWVIDPKTLKVSSEIDIGRGVAHQMVIRRE